MKLVMEYWIVEVVVENLKVKQDLFKRIEKIRKPGTKKLFLYMEKDIIAIWKNMLIRK